MESIFQLSCSPFLSPQKQMATLSPSTPHPSRAPPPFLFSGPRSGNASAASLNISPPSTSTSATTTSNNNNNNNNNNNPTTTYLNKQQTPSPRAPHLTRSRSSRGPETTSSSPLRSSVGDIHPNFNYYGTTTTSSYSNSNNNNKKKRTIAATSEGDRATDALWKEMQATLADVEVSAFHSTHVFGEAHAIALEELRAAQIQLAQAWGSDVGVGVGVGVDAEEDLNRDEKTREKRGDDGKNDNNDSKNDNNDEDDEDDDDDDDEERDVLVARRRREANERFFEKVREGVRNVVGKLEGVAEKMGKVETESREIWGG